VKSNFTGTEHFKLGTSDVISCSCGCGFLPDQDFMEKVEALRVKAGFAFPVTSTARCPTYNSKVSSTGTTGPHTTGRAIDIGVSGPLAYMLLKLAFEAGFTGVGVNQKGGGRFVHLDMIEKSQTIIRPTVWSY